MKTLSTLLFALCGIVLYSQEYHLVELESRAPSVMDQVKNYEGFPVIPFMANDIEGIEQTNFRYRDLEQSMLLWFWEIDNSKCTDMITFLNILQKKQEGHIQIVSFASEPKQSVLQFLETKSVSFPVISDSKTFAEGPYGGDLGYPRLFFIDRFGVTRWVLPSESLQNPEQAQKFITALVNQLIKI